MQDSPRLHEAATFAGEWDVVSGDTTCRVLLSIERIESANAHVLTEADDCLSRFLGEQVIGWRPATDGIDTVRPDRLSAGFFSFNGKDAVLTRPGGRITLTRRASR